MSTALRSVLLAAVALLVLACAYLGYRTVTLSQEVAFLKARVIPLDVKQVMARKLRYADRPGTRAERGSATRRS